jgi:hypothetical protein
MRSRKEIIMKMKLAFALVSAASLAVVPAFAEEAPATSTTAATSNAGAAAEGGKEFGNPGTINFGAATNLNFASSSTKDKDGNDAGKQTTFGLTLDAAYFVAEGISVGALLGFDSLSTKDAKGNDGIGLSTIRVGPTVGYNLWLTPGQLSLWPQARLTYASTSKKAAGQDAGSSTAMTFTVWVPLLIHPVKHFHFGVGPFVDMDLQAKDKPPTGDAVDGNKTTTFGLMGEIAGWL